MDLNCLTAGETLASLSSAQKLTHIQVRPMHTTANDDGGTRSSVQGGMPGTADFWSIYAMCASGDAIPLHDENDLPELVQALAYIVEEMDLPVSYHDTKRGSMEPLSIQELGEHLKFVIIDELDEEAAQEGHEDRLDDFENHDLAPLREAMEALRELAEENESGCWQSPSP